MKLGKPLGEIFEKPERIFAKFFKLSFSVNPFVDDLIPPPSEFGKKSPELQNKNQNFNSGHMACKILAQAGP